MAFFVLIGLVFALIIYISLAKKKKRALLISIAILGLYHLYVRYSCGPNPWDVRVMKPMANAISNYIVKHGIPKSLSEIPGLPYRLEGCKREENNGSIHEDCSFKANDRSINVEFRMGDYTIDRVNHKKIVMTMRNEKSETGVHVYLKNTNNTSFVLQGMGFYSGRADGICNPMRQ